MVQDLEGAAASKFGQGRGKERPRPRPESGRLRLVVAIESAAAALLRRRADSLRSLYLRTVDSWIPYEIREGDLETLRRARLIVGFTFVLLVLATEAVPFFHWVLTPEGSVWVYCSLLIGLTMTLAIPPLLRREQVEFAANVLVGAASLVVVTCFAVIGGIEAPVLHWVALMPLLAILMGSRRSAWWT